MKQLLVFLFCIFSIANVQGQGVTLLYIKNQGWHNRTSWIQINAPAGHTPIQKVPTDLDDVVFSKSMSGIESVHFVHYDSGGPKIDSLVIGGSGTQGYRCHSLHVSGMNLGFAISSIYSGLPIAVYTNKGGRVLIDSGANFSEGIFHLYGGDSSLTDLEVLNSALGQLFSHQVVSSVDLEPEGKARFVNSKLGGEGFGAANGGDIYADSCDFNTNYFSVGKGGSATITNCRFHDIPGYGLQFHIGSNANFFSSNVEIDAFIGSLYTSGSTLSGNIHISNALSSLLGQEDPANPLPNIINGNLTIGQTDGLGIVGDLKISGDLFVYVPKLFFGEGTNVSVNGENIFKIGGVLNYGDSLFINRCQLGYCHFKLEFFGDANSNVYWAGGMPIDTLVVNKPNCSKVTFNNSIYVSGEVRVQSGQLALTANDTISYKMVCAGDLNISQGGGVFLRRDSIGNVANIAVGGAIHDYNATADSTCTGFSNPYNGTFAFYKTATGKGRHAITMASSANVGNMRLIGDTASDFQLESNLSVNNVSFINPGKIALGDHNLTVNGTISNYGPDKYFVTDGSGKLQLNNIGSSETIFPVGPSMNSYNPVSIINTGLPDNFLVSVRPFVLAGGSSGSAISNKVVNRTWYIDEQTPGGSNATVKVQWHAEDELNDFIRTATYLSHFTAGNWDSTTMAPAVGSNPYSLTRAAVTSFSPFAVFSTGVVTAVNTPSSNAALLLFPNPVKDQLFLRLPNRAMATTLQLIDSKGTIIRTTQIRPGATNATMGISNLPAGFYLLVMQSGNRRETLPFLKQ